MNKKGFNMTIPQMILGFVSIVVAIIGTRVFWGAVAPIFGMSWETSLARNSAMIMTFLVISFVFYVIVYGMIMGRKPAIFGSTAKEEAYVP